MSKRRSNDKENKIKNFNDIFSTNLETTLFYNSQQNREMLALPFFDHAKLE